jgi:lipopolysaccharide/colanic/teichoic acid biosynthesis glycosyltransferase
LSQDDLIDMSSVTTNVQGVPAEGANGTAASASGNGAANGRASANGDVSSNGHATRFNYTPLFAPPQAGRERRRAQGHALVERNRRFLNVLIGAGALVVVSPLMVLIAIAVKLTSRGPILYRQRRVGLDRRRPMGSPMESGRRRQDRGGRIFTIYKFRTMSVLRHEQGEVWATPNDPRVTPVGAILRKYRLDELPQLFNVLRGDMNIVGPRPEQPEIFQQLRSKVERYVERQRVLPGITGWAQVNQSYDQCLEDVRTKVGLDLEYIRRRSTVEDLKIMARTLPVMIGKKGSV